MKYDVAIVGSGPAGLTAGIFATRGGLKTVCFDHSGFGGQASLSYDISNYPGFNSISGYDLTEKMFEQAKYNGVEFVDGKVENIKQQNQQFELAVNGNRYLASKLIIASGTIPKALGVGEENFIGKGVSYCASCDGNFFKNKTVAIVGGGDTAFEYAEYMSRIANKIYLLNRSEKFRASDFRVENAKKIKNLEILTNAVVLKIVGDHTVEEIECEVNGKSEKLKIDGLFVAIGHEPKVDFLDFEIDKDSNGYVVTNENMQTSVKNVYACGDVIQKHFRQVITACADGAIAGNACITKEG